MTAIDVDLTVDDAQRCRMLERRVAELTAQAEHLAALVAAAPLDGAGSGTALSIRELEVLEANSRGLRVAEMGRELYLSRNTIKTHLRGAYRKIGANDRVQAFAWWYTHPEVAVELERQRALLVPPSGRARLAWGAES